MIPITGQETITIMECAKLVVNEGLRFNVYPVLILAITVIILYLTLISLLLKLLKYRKYLRQKGLLQDYVVWEFKRKEQ